MAKVREHDLSALSDSELAGLVRGLAGQYQVPPEYREDLVQVGYVGLMKAINSFDPAIREDLKAFLRGRLLVGAW